MQTPVYIVINPNCNQGRGWKKWLSIQPEVRRRFPSAVEIVTRNKEDLNEQLTAIDTQQEEALVISAGGDGSANLLANLLMEPGQKLNYTIGAIGLGSSNDFLKPFRSFIDSVPVRLNTTLPPRFHDIGNIRYRDENHLEKQKWFLVNASFGVTAEGNWNFNNPGRVLRWLKKTNVNSAIKYTAITTILRYRNRSASIRFNDMEKSTIISNINILKSPFFSGSLHYTQDILPDDGRFGLNICMDMKKRELLQTLLQLEKGKFGTNKKQLSVFTDSFSLRSETPLVFECDGETELSTCVDISITPKAIPVLTA